MIVRNHAMSMPATPISRRQGLPTNKLTPTQDGEVAVKPTRTTHPSTPISTMTASPLRISTYRGMFRNEMRHQCRKCSAEETKTKINLHRDAIDEKVCLAVAMLDNWPRYSIIDTDTPEEGWETPLSQSIRKAIRNFG